MSKVDKIVVPAAGLGQRLLTVTKELPKEMLPIFALDHNGEICIKPLFEQIFNQSYQVGFRKFCIIVGKQKRAIEDHFTPDYAFLKEINFKKKSVAKDLEIFYNGVSNSTINWTNQLGNFGFGHAVLMAETFVGNDEFVVEAGDTLILSNNKVPLQKIRESELKGKYDATILIQEVEDPRRYGVVSFKEKNGEIIITKVVEKPTKPESNFIIQPIYHFKPSIFEMLKQIKFGKKELQLTDGIQRLIQKGGTVKGILLKKTDVVLDVGTPDSFWATQRLSYKYANLSPR